MVRANPHNQFLTCLYNVPQEINLYDLFYDGGGVREAPSQEELEQLGVLAEDGSQICPTDKFTRAWPSPARTAAPAAAPMCCGAGRWDW